MGLRRFLTFLEEQSSRRSSFETTTCFVCSREVEREVTAYAGRTLPGTWWASDRRGTSRVLPGPWPLALQHAVAGVVAVVGSITVLLV